MGDSFQDFGEYGALKMGLDGPLDDGLLADIQVRSHITELKTMPSA